MRTSAVAGVDAYRGGWVAVVVEPHGVSIEPRPTFAEIAALDVGVIAVDMPMLSAQPGPRAADVAARRFVGRRASSVFPTPSRAVLEAPTYADAVELARSLTGKAISQQSFALRKRILEVDAIAAADERVIEAHPEVSFAALAGAPLVHSKHSAEGRAERAGLLARAGVRLPPRVRGVPEIDVLDAAAVAWSAARWARGEAISLPAAHADRLGAIWY